MTLILTLMALIVAAVAWAAVRGIADHVNMLAMRVDAMERRKHIAGPITYRALVRNKGQRKPQPLDLVASNESDAVRQLIAKGFAGPDIISLELKKEE